MTIIRHKLITTRDGGAACNCGYDPRIVLEENFDWTDAARAVVAHVKRSRRWKYLGAETHYGYRYHIWENELSKRRYAWEAGQYRETLTGRSWFAGYAQWAWSA